MYFCLVPSRLFHNTQDYYGVTNFSCCDHFANDPKMYSVGRIGGYMDAEDKNCKSAIYYTKRRNEEINDVYNQHTGNTRLVGNSNLQYQIFFPRT